MWPLAWVDAVDGGQAEAGSGALGLGGEERLEGVLGDLGGHAAAGVADPKPDVARPCWAGDPPAMAAASTVTLEVSMVGVPPSGMASRALTAKLTSTASIWPGSARTGHSPPSSEVTSSTCSPMVRRSISCTPWMTSLRSRARGRTTSRRAKASAGGLGRRPVRPPAGSARRQRGPSRRTALCPVGLGRGRSFPRRRRRRS